MHALAASTQHCVCRHQNQSQNINGAIGGQFQMSPAELSVCQSQTIHNSQNQNQNQNDKENDLWTWVCLPIYAFCLCIASFFVQKLSSSIFPCSLFVRPASVTSPLISSICCFRPYKLTLWQFLW